MPGEKWEPPGETQASEKGKAIFLLAAPDPHPPPPSDAGPKLALLPRFFLPGP